MHALLSTLPDRAAERWPTKDAFRFGGEGLDYATVATRSNQLAHALIGQRVLRGDRVGLLLEKGLESAVALYGIMKAGAAYVPLDPAAPMARLEYMINHCGIRVIVAAPHMAAPLAPLASMACLNERCPGLEAVIGLTEAPGLRTMGWPEVYREPYWHPDVKLRPGDLAYILFSSGATGMPKGMMHTHGSGFGYASAARNLYQVRAEDRLGNHSPLHWDMSAFEYFSGPLAGATTVIIPEACTRLPARLSQLMEQERLSFWYSVPLPLIQLLLRGKLEQRDLSALRWVMFGGKPFPPSYLQALMERWPHARFSRIYGPAEVNQCTYYHLPEPPTDPNAPIPMGKLWDAAEGLVLDEDGQAVAPGGVGELLIRGRTMMRGYWGRPDLNTRAFHHPPQEDGAGPYFRTGDLVRVQEDGTLHFLGQKDRLTKIHGKGKLPADGP